jgi:hypothetical protein
MGLCEFIGKVACYTVIPATLVGIIAYHCGVSDAEKEFKSGAKCGIAVKGNFHDTPVVSNPETKQKYFVKFSEQKLEEVTEKSVREIEKNGLYNAFNK